MIKVGQIYTYKGQPYVITKLMTETPYKEGRAVERFYRLFEIERKEERRDEYL